MENKDRQLQGKLVLLMLLGTKSSEEMLAGDVVTTAGDGNVSVFGFLQVLCSMCQWTVVLATCSIPVGVAEVGGLDGACM